MSLEFPSPFGVLPTLQETVHVQVGEQWADHSTLRGPAVVVLPTRQPTFPVPVAFLDRNSKPHLDQTQHVPIDDSAGDTLHQFAVWNRIEVFGQISVNYICIACTQELMYSSDSVLRTPLRSVAESIRFQIRLEDRLDHQLSGSLNDSVLDTRNTERPFAATGLGYLHPPHRLWSIRLVA